MDQLAEIERLQAAGKLQREMAVILGLSRPRVANLVRVLALPAFLLELVRSGELTPKHGELLAGIKDSAVQRRLGESALAGRWTTARLAKEIDRSRGKRDRDDVHKDADIAHLERRLGEHLGTTVQIETGAGHGGALRLFYTDLDTLSGLLERLGFSE
uniref:ParB/Spo0J HTH domain-containing protein n=1 Tax=Stenotrophomonas maltophilia TaxID=40324 RepID=Q7WZM6_STEMA|nr:hypothetical protein [Stenotrophomonas maltophilia]